MRLAWATTGEGITSTTAWKVVVERGSHCCMIKVRRLRVSLGFRSRGEILIDRALTILVTASGLLLDQLRVLPVCEKELELTSLLERCCIPARYSPVRTAQTSV